MRYDTYSIEQLVREIRYCEQRLAQTRSADRRHRCARKRNNLRQALLRRKAAVHAG